MKNVGLDCSASIRDVAGWEKRYLAQGGMGNSAYGEVAKGANSPIGDYVFFAKKKQFQFNSFLELNYMKEPGRGGRIVLEQFVPSQNKPAECLEEKLSKRMGRIFRIE